MAANEKVLLEIAGDSSGAEGALGRVQSALETVAKSATVERLAAAGAQLQKIFGGIADAGKSLISSSVQIAMRNEVLALSMHVVGQNAGYSAAQLDALEAGVRGLGISTSQARLAITRMVQGQLDLSKATDLARAAQNLAVIAGENSSDTFGNMMESINALQPRMLRQYGIVASTDQILGDLANSTDAAAKRNRFLEFILTEASRTAGVYEQSLGVVGKRMTSLPRLIEDAKAAFGKWFIPIWGVAVDLASKLLKAFQALPEGAQRAIAIIVAIGTALAIAGAAFGGLLVAIPTLIAGFAALSAAASPILAIVAPIVAILAVLAAAAAALYVVWTQNWGGIRTAVQSAWATVKPLLDQFIALFTGWGAQIWGQMRAIGSAIWDLVKKIIVPLFGDLAFTVKGINWAGIFGDLSNALNVVGGLITGFLTTIQRLLAGEGTKAFSSLGEAALNGLTMVALIFDKYIKRALLWGWNLVVQVANGISKAAQSVLTRVMQTIGNIIGRFLAPGSPPKEGPLSQIAKWGQGVMNTYLRAFQTADFGMLKEMLSPIKQALDMAVRAGDLKEADLGQVFATAREQVAGLIATFNETGEISEEQLGKIAETLGAGSEEYVKMIRLQLQYQQAQRNLASVQEEVAAAERRGFIPAELKKKLSLAESAAKAAEDQYNWQQAYLEAQQESADVQIQMLEAMQDLADALRETGIAPVQPAAGEGVETAGAMPGLPELAIDTSGLDAVAPKLGEMTPEFEEMKAKIQEFLALPLEGKLMTIAQYLGDATGIDFPGYLQKIFDIADQIEEKGLLTVVTDWVDKGLAYIEDNWEDWAVSIGEWIFSVFTTAITILNEKIGEAEVALNTWFGSIVERWKTWISAKVPEWAASVKDKFVTLMQTFLTLLATTTPVWIARIVIWFAGIVSTFITRVLAKIDEWAKRLKEVGETMVTKIREGLYAAWDIAKRIGELISGLFTTLTSGEFLTPMFNFGKALVNSIKNGIDSAWMALVLWFKELLRKLRDILPGSEPRDPTSPMRNLARTGRALVENIASGIDFAPLHGALQAELKRTQGILNEGMGGINIEQNIEGGLIFPNVRDGRGAQGVRTGIDRQALASLMAARTGGIA